MLYCQYKYIYTGVSESHIGSGPYSKQGCTRMGWSQDFSPFQFLKPPLLEAKVKAPLEEGYCGWGLLQAYAAAPGQFNS